MFPLRWTACCPSSPASRNPRCRRSGRWVVGQIAQTQLRTVTGMLVGARLSRVWHLARVIWVLDRGFTSERNRRYLQRAGGHYIVGEKLRAGSQEARAALQRQGRYHVVQGNLRVKQVRIDDGTDRDRFVICHNPERAQRDRTVREQILARLSEQIAGTDKLTAAKRSELYGALATKPAFRRLLRRTPTGKLRIDRAAINRRGSTASSCSEPATRASAPRTSRSATRRRMRPSAAGAT